MAIVIGIEKMPRWGVYVNAIKQYYVEVEGTLTPQEKTRGIMARAHDFAMDAVAAENAETDGPACVDGVLFERFSPSDGRVRDFIVYKDGRYLIIEDYGAHGELFFVAADDTNAADELMEAGAVRNPEVWQGNSAVWDKLLTSAHTWFNATLEAERALLSIENGQPYDIIRKGGE